MIGVLVAGLGNMGRSHALAYHRDPAFELVGLVNRSAPTLDPALVGYAVTPDFHKALARLKPDLVCVSTYSDSHADYAIAAMEAGAYVFEEKPLATTVADARLIAEARSLGGPLWRAILENLNPTRHMNDAVQSVAICLAADENVRLGQPVKL